MQKHSYLSLGPSGFHRIAYTEWGRQENPHTVICMHGLTRNGRDFDTLAGRLQTRCRVLCPDAPGRGSSDWLPQAEQYNFTQYTADASALIARASAPSPDSVRGTPVVEKAAWTLDWVGTSMGGLIGLMLAAMPKSPIRKLILNDVGPEVPASALNRLGKYVGNAPSFKTLHDFEVYLRQIHAPFGPLTDAQWRHLAEHSHRLENGTYRNHYDPTIGQAFAQPVSEDVTLWALWEQVSIPVLVLRGAESDLLTRETVDRMQAEKPDLEVAEFDQVGHAPALMDEKQIGVIETFLFS